MIKIIPLLLLLFVSQFSHAEIFQCKDKAGNIVFKDSSCSSSENLINTITYELAQPPSSEDLKQNDKLKVIYEGKKRGTDTRFVRIAIIEETSTYLMLEVTGYYSGIPHGKLQFRVVPNTSWAYSGDVHATKRGYVTAITRISLSSDAKDTEKSDILSLQLWHYYTKNSEKKANRLSMLTVPFKKEWSK